LHAAALHGAAGARAAAFHSSTGAAWHFLSNCQAGATHKDGNGCKSEKSVRSHHFISSSLLGKRALESASRQAGRCASSRADP
jgi:hypothetical protein